MNAQQGSITTVECGTDSCVDWVEGQEKWLVTYNMNRCVAIVVINTTPAFLMHVDISNVNSVEDASEGFCKWWDRENEKFKDSRIFIICPSNPHEGEETNNTGWLKEAVKDATKKLNRVARTHAALIGGSNSVEIYHNASVPCSK